MKIYSILLISARRSSHLGSTTPVLWWKRNKTHKNREYKNEGDKMEDRWDSVTGSEDARLSVRRLAPSCGSSCLTPAPQLSSVSGVITIVNWQTALRWNHLGAQPSHNALWETLSPALRDESSHADHIKRSSHRCVQLKFSSPRRCFHRRIHSHRRVHRGHDLLTSWGPLEAEAAGAVSMATAVGRMSLCETQNSYVC